MSNDDTHDALVLAFQVYDGEQKLELYNDKTENAKQNDYEKLAHLMNDELNVRLGT